MKADEILRQSASEQSTRIAALEKLAERPTDELFGLLYVRAVQSTTSNPMGGPLQMQPLAENAVRSGEAAAVGRRIFMRWSRTLHAFVCAPGPEDAELRAKLVHAIVGKGGGATAIVAGTLVASFGLSPAVAALLSALMLKLIVAPAAEELCASWQSYNVTAAVAGALDL